MKQFFLGLAIFLQVVSVFSPYVYGQEASSSSTPSATYITPSISPTPSPLPSLSPLVSPLTSATPSPTLLSTVEPTQFNQVTPTTFLKDSPTPQIFLNKFPKEKSSSRKLAVQPQYNRKYKEGEVLVKFKQSTKLSSQVGKDKANQIAKKYAFAKKEDIVKQNFSVYSIPPNTTVEEAVKKLKSDQEVEYAQPNYQYKPAEVGTNDPNKTSLWGLDNTGQTVNGVVGSVDADIDAPEAWTLAQGAGVTVAVIDTGVDYTHEDLAANMWDGSSCKDENNNTIAGGCLYGFDYEENDRDPKPVDNDHGTHVAGIIGAVSNNAKGIVGVAPQAKIMALKSSLLTSELVKAISFAQNNGAKVINASWVGYSTDTILEAAVSNYTGLFVAAAGNDGFNNDTMRAVPCSYTASNVICVAATDSNDNLASFSNYGQNTVDIAAPGVNILSTTDNFSQAINLTETFESTSPPALPAGYTKTGNAGTADVTSQYGSGWGKVLFGDVTRPYVPNANTTTTSPTINANGQTGAYLFFYTICDTEYTNPYSGSDYMSLEATGDGANFTELTRWNEKSIDDLSGDTDSVTQAYDYMRVAIPSAMLTNNFKYRFRWVSDSDADRGTNAEGCLVDDVQITSFVKTPESEYAYKSGTSMAAPMVSGAGAILLQQNPSYNNVQIKNLILDYGEYKSNLSNVTTTGRRLNLLYSLNRVVTNAEKVHVFRFWNLITGVHFYTANAAEKDEIIRKYPTIWRYEDIAYDAYNVQKPDTIPVFRFWSPVTGKHFYTANAAEKDEVIRKYSQNIWRYEGIAWYSYPAYSSVSSRIVYRFWSPAKGSHFYTANAAEKDEVIRKYSPNIWVLEEAAWKEVN